VEELRVAWEQVQVAIAPADPVYNNPLIGLQATFGSYSVRGHFDSLRLVGAAAREMLRQAAANRWQVPLAECSAADGEVVHASSGRKLRYGDLVAEAATLPPPENPVLTPREEWRLLGTRLPRKDTPPKLDGSAVFGMDVRVDGMFVGALAACPVVGGPAQVDPAPRWPRGRPKVALPDAVIVLADHYWAQTACGARRSGTGSNEALTPRSGSRDRASEGGVTVATNDGAEDLLAAPDETVIEARYEVPYLAHATMEPMNATAHVRDDGVEIWAPTQSPGIARFVVAGALSIDPASVTVHLTFGGGLLAQRERLVLYAVEGAPAASGDGRLVPRGRHAARFLPHLGRGKRRAARPQRAITAWHGRYARQSIMARLARGAGGADDTSLKARSIFLPIRGSGTTMPGWRPGCRWLLPPGHNQNAFLPRASSTNWRTTPA
jgi:isoquinoline 1-oxidoreductase beta subunit